MDEATTDSRESLVFSWMAPLLRVVGREVQPWPSFSAHDSHGLGRQMIYFSLFMSRTNNAETSCQMRNNLIWLLQLLHEEALAVPRAGQGRAGQDSAVLCPILFIPWVWPPSVPGEFICSAKCNAAYKLWFLKSYLTQTLFFGSRSIYPPPYQVIHPNVLQTRYIKYFKQCLIISPASPSV